MAGAFVRPEQVRIPCAGAGFGDAGWVLLKKRLTAGEQRAQMQRCQKGEVRVTDRGLAGEVTIDPFEYARALVVAYLLDWSLETDDGAAVPIRGLSVPELEAVIDSLESDVYAALVKTCEAHERRMLLERAAQKKTPVGELTSSAI